MPTLFDAAQALDNRAEEVRTRLAGERSFDEGAIGLALNRLEDGVNTATAAMSREARFGRSGTEEYRLLEEVHRKATAVLQAGGAALSAARGSFDEGGSVRQLGQRRVTPQGLFVGGIIGFGMAFLALRWLGSRGK